MLPYNATAGPDAEIPASKQPRVTQRRKRLEFMSTNDTARPAPLRVFLVEDSAILRERLVETLGAWGDTTIVGHAETEAAADLALQAQEWDVLVLDLQLLQGTGLGVLQRLKNYRRAGTIVIVLTNYVIPIYRNRALQLGADYFLDKANEFARIKDALNEFSQKRDSACGSSSGNQTQPSA
jgi:DNA-binding NarL/FixJ family response regulator